MLNTQPRFKCEYKHVIQRCESIFCSYGYRCNSEICVNITQTMENIAEFDLKVDTCFVLQKILLTLQG